MMFSSLTQSLSPTQPSHLQLVPRFGTNNPYLPTYTQFLQTTFADSFEKDAFNLIQRLQEREPKGPRQKDIMGRPKRAPHEELALFLTKGNMEPFFPGLAKFNYELRQLLIAAGKIPQWLGKISSQYKLDEQHVHFSKEDAQKRLNALREAVVNFTRPF